jgi:hypothetical protein
MRNQKQMCDTLQLNLHSLICQPVFQHDLQNIADLVFTEMFWLSFPRFPYRLANFWCSAISADLVFHERDTRNTPEVPGEFVEDIDGGLRRNSSKKGNTTLTI